MAEYLPLIVLLVGGYALWSSLQSRKSTPVSAQSHAQPLVTQLQLPNVSAVMTTTWTNLWTKLKQQVPDTSFLNELSGNRTKLVALAFLLLAVNEYLAIINPKVVNTLLIAGAGLGLYFLRVAIENMEKRIIAALHAQKEQGNAEQVVSEKSDPAEAGNQGA
jgi:hypothetical protein